MTMKMFEVYIDEIVDVWGDKILASMNETEVGGNREDVREFKQWLLSEYNLHKVLSNTEEGTLIMVRNDATEEWEVREYVGIMNELVWCYTEDDDEYRTAQSWKMARLQ